MICFCINLHCNLFIKNKSVALNNCGSKNETFGDQCQCYPTINYIICNGLTTSISLNNSYHFNGLLSKNSKKPIFTNNTFKQIVISSLIIQQTTNIAEDFSQLLSVAQINIKFLSMSNNNFVLNFKNVNFDKMKSINIENVFTIKSFNFVAILKSIKMTHLNLINIDSIEPFLPINCLNFTNSNLRFVELNNCTFKNINKFTVVFTPAKCIETEQISLVFKNNKQLERFDFQSLKNETKCKYHIDLSYNANLKQNLLTSQYKFLNLFNEDQIFLQLQETILDCDCNLFNWYNAKVRKNYIHGLNCVIFKNNTRTDQRKMLDKLLISDVC